MRDYFIVFIIVASVPIGLLRPYLGFLAYCWVSYMYPHMLAWSFAQNFPGAKLTAITAITSTLFNREGSLSPLGKRESIAMLLFWAMITISTALAVYPSAAWLRWQDVSKLIVMGLLAAVLLNSQQRIKYFLLLVAFSIGFYGIKGGIFSVKSGGDAMIWGPGTSIISSNNSIGFALNMCLPILWFLAKEERGILRRILE